MQGAIATVLIRRRSGNKKVDLDLDLEVTPRSNVRISASTTAFEPQFVRG